MFDYQASQQTDGADDLKQQRHGISIYLFPLALAFSAEAFPPILATLARSSFDNAAKPAFFFFLPLLLLAMRSPDLQLDQRIASSLVGPDFVGNSYSASVFVSLDSILENDKENLEGKIVVLAGYGSGSRAVIQANLFAQGCRKEAKKLDLIPRLGQRKKLSIEEYEMIHRGEVSRENYPILRKPRFVLESIGKTGTKEEGDRKYTFVS